MRQHNMTPERTNFSRLHVKAMLGRLPNNTSREAFMRGELKKANLTEDEVEKILSDLDSY